jgi:hypothetical protein
MIKLTRELKLLTRYDIGHLTPVIASACRPVQAGKRLMLTNAR